MVGRFLTSFLNLYQGIHPRAIDIAVVTLATIDTYVDILRSGATLANASLLVNGALVLARLSLLASFLVTRRLTILHADDGLAHLVLGGVARQGTLVALVIALVTVTDDAFGTARAAVTIGARACHFGVVNAALLAARFELLNNLELIRVARGETLQLVLASVDVDLDHGLGAELVRVADPLTHDDLAIALLAIPSQYRAGCVDIFGTEIDIAKIVIDHRGCLFSRWRFSRLLSRRNRRECRYSGSCSRLLARFSVLFLWFATNCSVLTVVTSG
jgi:hypothetical protein